MKMSKRIIIVVLTMAVIFSAFAFTASAEQVTIDNYDHVLDYFTEKTVFSYDFAGENSDYTQSLLTPVSTRITHALVDDASAPGGKYFETRIVYPSIGNGGNNSVFMNWNDEEGIDDFYLDVTLSAGKGEQTSASKIPYFPRYRVVVGGETFTDVNNANAAKDISIATLDFRAGDANGENVNTGIGRFSYLQKVVNESRDPATGELVVTYTSKTATTSYEINAENWYTLSITYNVKEQAASITVTNVNDPADTITVTDGYIPLNVVKNIRVGVYGTDTQFSGGNILKIASLDAAGGTVRRNLVDRDAGIDAAILDMYGIFESDIPISDKIGLCDIVNKIVLDYGYISADDEVNNAINELRYGGINLYADEVADFLDYYSSLATYSDKREALDKNLPYADILEGMDLSLLGDSNAVSAIENNIDKIRAADRALKDTEQQSLAFINALAGAEAVHESNDYNELIGYYNAASAYSPDLTYEGVEDVNVYYAAISDKLASMKVEADKFITKVNTASNENNSFIVRYETYLAIDTNVNITYPGIQEALDVYNMTVKPYFDKQIEISNSFISYVSKADYADYISAKQDNLDKAIEYMELAPADFPGVAEAKILYDDIQYYIDVQKKNANAYIDSVNALIGLTGYDLEAAVYVAQQLKDAGNVLGVDGVTEANVLLDTVIASIDLPDKYSSHFIRLVNSIDSAESIDARYALIIEARNAEKDATKSNKRVKEASAKLSAVIEAYNLEVSKINSSFSSANGVAVNTIGKGSAESDIGSVAPENIIPERIDRYGIIIALSILLVSFVAVAIAIWKLITSKTPIDTYLKKM